MQSRDGTRHAHGQMVVMVQSGIILAVTQKHFRVRRTGCLLAKVISGRLAFRRTKDQKATASDVSGRRMRDGQSKSRGNCCIYGIASSTQYVRADLRGDLVL